MQPQQPVYGPPQVTPPSVPQPGGDPYGFIVNPGKPPRKSLFGTTNSPVKRVILVVVAIFVGLLLLVGLKNIFSGGEPINSASLLSAAEDQSELVHLSGIGIQDAVSQDMKNFAITTSLSATSQQKQLLSYLQTHKVKGSAKQLALKENAAADSQLTAAQAASTFDPTFATVMQTELTTYESDLRHAYTLNNGTKARALLNTDYQGASLLLKQLTAPDS